MNTDLEISEVHVRQETVRLDYDTRCLGRSHDRRLSDLHIRMEQYLGNGSAPDNYTFRIIIRTHEDKNELELKRYDSKTAWTR